jgi:hypothetical protein
LGFVFFSFGLGFSKRTGLDDATLNGLGTQKGSRKREKKKKERKGEQKGSSESFQQQMDTEHLGSPIAPGLIILDL